SFMPSTLEGFLLDVTVGLVVMEAVMIKNNRGYFT
ncbi:MAG: hypothetical protein RLZZ338_4319, partial [Cyanobacteriota bacterium]